MEDVVIKFPFGGGSLCAEYISASFATEEPSSRDAYEGIYPSGSSASAKRARSRIIGPWHEGPRADSVGGSAWEKEYQEEVTVLVETLNKLIKRK